MHKEKFKKIVSNIDIARSKVLLSKLLTVYVTVLLVFISTIIVSPAEAVSLNPSGTVSRTLRIGDAGSDVLTLQMNLTWRGYYIGENNGKYDSATAAAVKKFKVENGLASDFVASIQMLKLLNIHQQTPVKGTVAVVGDSLSAAARFDIAKELHAKGYRILNMYTVGGTSMRGGNYWRDVSGSDIIDQFIASGINPNNWLFVLGTNDVIWDTMDTNKWSTVQGEIKQTLAQIEKTDSVYWNNVVMYDNTNSPGDQFQGSSDFNRWLAIEAGNRANLKVTDWYTKVTSSKTKLLKDGVHYYPEYSSMFARFITSKM